MYRRDTPLFTERVLAADLGVHRRSVRAAIEQLMQEAEHLRYIRDQGFGGAVFYPYAYRRRSRESCGPTDRAGKFTGHH